MTLDQLPKQEGISHFAIIKILKSFSEDEINEFGKFLNSPFFNNHSTLTRLYAELKKHHPDYSDKSVSRQHLFNVASIGKIYDDQLMRKYLSRLTQFAEEYLNIVQVRSEKDRKELNVLLQYSKRNLRDAYSRKLKTLEEFYNRETKIDHEYFLMRHQLSSMKHNIRSFENNIALNVDDIYDSHDYLLNYFFIQSVNTITHLQTDRFSYSSNEKADLLELLVEKSNLVECINEVKKLTPLKDNTKLVFLNILLNDLKLTSEKSDVKVYKKLKSLIYEHSEILSRSIMQYYLKRLIVFCIIESSKGKLDMNREIFENYRMLIERDLFNLDGTKELTLLDFRLMLSSALKAGEFDWSRKFINENLGMVKDETKENIHNYAHACLLFGEGKLSEALEYISKIELDSMPLTIDNYVMKAKIFFLLGHNDSALSILDSFRHFVRSNNKISDFHRETLSNFMRCFRKIIRYSVRIDKRQIKNLLGELKSATNTREKKWMIEIASGLLSKT